jgi:ADP-ribosylglycohydrolase
MRGRRRGAFIGLAVGDALGAAVEFRAPGSFTPVNGYREGGPHHLAAGEWTDDTSMALALADSIATVGWDLNDQANRYVEWYRTGKYSVTGRCFDIGTTTRCALDNFGADKDARNSGDRSEKASGKARSCAWRRFPFDSSNSTPTRSTNLQGWRTSPVCQRTPASNAVPRADTWR